MTQFKPVPRQWFFDPKRCEWVRNTALVTDEMIRVTEQLHYCRWTWGRRYRALTRQWDHLDAEWDQLKTSFVRSSKLLAGDVQIEADETRSLYPNNPALWKKKE